MASLILAAFSTFESAAAAREAHARLEKQDTDMRTEVSDRLIRIEDKIDSMAFWGLTKDPGKKK